MASKWLTVRDVASRLGMDESSIYRLVARRQIGHVRIGPHRGKVRFTESDVLAYEANCRVPVGEPPQEPVKRKVRRCPVSVRPDGLPLQHTSLKAGLARRAALRGQPN